VTHRKQQKSQKGDITYHRLTVNVLLNNITDIIQQHIDTQSV